MVDTPTERARASDRDDAARLALQLRSLPGAVAAEVMLRRRVRDPLTNTEPTPYASAAIVVDSPAYRGAAVAATTRLLRAAAPEVVRPEVLVAVAAPRAAMASVGPFEVAPATRPRLMATLIGGLLVIAALAAYIAWRARRQTA